MAPPPHTRTSPQHTPQYASDTSLAVEDAVDRVELRKALRPLQCEWGPSTLTVRVEVEESAHSVVMRRGGGPGAPSREDMSAWVCGWFVWVWWVCW